MSDRDWSFGASSAKMMKKDRKKHKESAFDNMVWGYTPPVGEEPNHDPEGDDYVYGLLRLKFPIPSREHGSEFATVSVGGAKEEEHIPKQTFLVHKQLLVRASDFFSTALQKNFVEGKTNQIDLDWACPAAFEVLYQTLYTGRVKHADFYTHYYNHKLKYKHNGENGSVAVIPEDVLWLRTFNLAHFTMFRELLSVAFERIRELFNSRVRQVASPLFIQELYSNDDDDEDDKSTTATASTRLHDFVAQHTAYWIKNDGQADSKEWTKILTQDPRFGTAVVCRLAELHSNLHAGSKEHPTQDDAFSHEKFFARVYGRQIGPPDPESA